MTKKPDPSRRSRKLPGVSASPSILALEKRIAFDGAAAHVAAKLAKPGVTDLTPVGPRETAALHTLEHLAEHGLPQSGIASLFAARGLGDLRNHGAKQDQSVVFIETDVPDLKDLVKNIDPHARIVLLDPSKDGVDEIANYLSAHQGIKNVYIFSHGGEAQLDLGTATLDAASMTGRYAADLATIKGSLAPNANILVYGCDFAENADGDSAAHLLSELTGASVAASTNPTGGTALGGDFVLEDQIGEITAPDILSSRIGLEYNGLLAAQTTGAFSVTTGTSGAATSSATVATATTADGAIKIVVTITPNSSNSANSITTTAPATFDSTAPAGTYPTSANGSTALEETLQFGGSTGNGKTDGTNSATISIAYYDATTGAPITVTNPIIYVDRIGGSGTNSSGAAVSNSSDLTITSTGATLTKLGASSTAFNVTSTDVYETVNTTLVTSGFSTDSNSDPTKGTSAGAIQVNGSYSTVTFNWSKASGSVNGGDRIDLVFSADTGVTKSGTLPNQTYNDGQSGISFATSQGFSNPSGLSTTYTATGLPAGLSINSATGQITGTIDHDASKNGATTSGAGATLDGTYNIVVTAKNSAGNSATQTFTIDSKNQAPTVGTKTTNQTNNDGDTITAVNAAAAFTDPNGDPLTFSATGLPAGLTISSAGMITGTVAKNATPGTYSVVVTGTDDKGASTTETFSWVVKDVPPTKNGTLPNQVVTDGQSGISITTSQGFNATNGNALTYSAAGLPAGLSINATTGTITGMIDHDASKNAPTTTGAGANLDGTYSVTVTASDGLGGTTTQTFTIDSKNTAPTLGTKTANQTNNDGDTITAVNAAAAFTDPNGDPLTYMATGLPPGLTISSTGSITGTVAGNAAPGTYSVVVTATDDKGAATNETFSWVIKDVPPAKNGTLPNQVVTDGQTGIAISTSQGFTATNGNALTYSTTGLPAGLSINTTTGQITGTVNHDASKNAPSQTGSGATLDGKYTVTVTASDGLGGTATQTFTIDSKNTAPTVGTTTSNQTNNDGDTITPVNAATAFSDTNGDPLTYTASNLPAGLTISSAGMITGTVAGNAAPGTYSVVVTATDDKGAATNETFSWVIKDVPPTKNGTLANQVYTDGQAGISISTSQGFSATNGNALTYSVAGLPAGLTINATTGQITGTVDHDASKNAPTKSGSGAGLDGTYSVTVTASDGLGGTATQTFTIDSKNTAPTVGATTSNQTNNDGDTITAVNAATAFSDSNGDPLTYTATGLPPGLTISSAGMITGTVAGNAAPGTYNVVVTATDDKGAPASESFSWLIKDVPPAKNGTLANQTYTDGQSNISITTSQGFNATNGNALTYSVSGLPAGLSINTTTGQITGTIDHDASKNAPTTTGSGAALDGKYTVMVTASDGLGGTATQTFTIDSKNTAPTVGATTSNQTNNDGDTITAVNAATAFSDSNGDPLTYTATGLPPGLTISSAGMITGMVAGNATPGTYSVVVTATDDKGAATNETFSWLIKDVPPAKNGTLPNQVVTDGQSNVSITTSQGFTATNGNALTYSVAGLPAGLSINMSTGQITGTVDHDASKNAPTKTGSGASLDGTYTVTVTASDGLGGTQTQTFTIDSKNTAPTVGTTTSNQTNNDGDTITPVNASTAFSDANGDPLTYTATGLPAGLTISPAGMITGTVAGNAAPGTYNVMITATDDKGAATTETFSWLIKDVPPTKNGTLPNQTTTDGQSGISISTSQGFSATNGNALTYSVAGLPAGLTINATTGQITGTVDHDASKNAPTKSGSGAGLDGTYSVTVTASDGLGGTATQTFTIDSKNTAPTVTATTSNQTNNDGDTITPVNVATAFSDANGDPLTYTATGLPPGLSISGAGTITGTVAGNAAPGTYTVMVTATDDKGAPASESFSWLIKDVPPAKNGTLPNQTTTDGQTGISIATSQGFTPTNGNVLTYSVSGLPAGLSINATTGQITGTIDHDASKKAPTTTGSGATLDGTYTVTVTASDGLGGTATQTFTIDSKNTAPTVGTKTADQTNNDGDTIATVNAAAAFSDANGDPLTYTASNLPPGLTISSTGKITGTIPKSAQPGTYAVVVTGTDDKGASTTETFNWVIKDVPPTKNGTLPNQTTNDGQAGISIATSQGFNNPNGNPLTYTVAGLPAGLSINATTGQITGTIDHDASKNAPTTTGSGSTLDGTYTVTVTANDGLGGTATQTFTIDSRNTAPTLGAKTTDQTNNDGDTVAAVNAAAAFSDTNGDPLTYTASNLPAGLSISSAGTITGTIAKNAQPGTYAVVVTATDDKGAATNETFNWVVKDVPPTATGTLANQTTTDGQSNISIATSQGFNSPNGNPLTYSASGLPAGLSINATTGQITGTIDHDASKNAPITSGSGATLDGTYTVTVTANDGLGGTATQTFKIDSTNQAPTLGTKTVDQTNNDGDTVTPVSAATAFSDPNGDPLTYSASSLPAGLTISPTGLISGTIAKNATPGTYAVMVTATDDKGAATTETFNWVVKDVPPTSSGTLPNQTTTDGQTGVSIATSQGFNSPLGNPLTYSATGLPAGLTIDPMTGKISGTVDHDASKNAPATSGSGATLDGTYTVVVTASDGLGGSATQTFKIDSTNQAPTVGTKTANQTNADGATVTPVNTAAAFTDPNGDPLTYSVSGLPAGLSINAATGVISGAIANNAAPGTYTVRVLATDDKGAATRETFTWTVTDVPPTANGTLANQTYADSTAGISIATAQGFNNPNGNTLTYAATGLPLGLSIDQNTGKITGQLDHDASKNAPTTSGSGGTLDGKYTVTVTVNDGLGGTATQTFTIDATNNAPTLVAQTPDQSGADGQKVSLDGAKAFNDSNVGDKLTYTVSGLPAGLSIDANSGLITGTIDPHASTTSPYTVTVTATDDKGAATSETFKWSVENVAPVATPPLPDTAANDGNAVTLTTANGFTNPNNLAYTYTATGLPSGLTINANTGVISGTLNHDASIQGSANGGVYTIAVTANDGQGGSATNTFHLTASNQAPVVGSTTANQANADGDAITAVDASKAFTDPNGDPLTYAASNLPAGLTIDPNTGLISGTVAANAKPGTYTVTVTATDDKGLATPETFTWTIADKPPVTNGTIANQTFADSTSGIVIDASTSFTSPNGLPLSYSASGLPAGLMLDPATGKITGTLDHDASVNAPTTTGAGATLDGKYTVTVTANDGQGGTATQIFTIDATNNAPVIGTATGAQSNTEGDSVTLNASTAFSDPNKGDTLTYSATTLPPGLTINATTGVISGTVNTGDAGTYAVMVTATDDKGAATTETFSWTIVPMAPGSTSPIPSVSAFDGQTISPIDTASHFDNAPTSYSASGLPAGLAIDTTTGQITGTLDHDASANATAKTGSGATLDGTYTIIVTASNAGGSTTQTFTLDSVNQAPTLGTKTADQSSTTGQTIATVDASMPFADPNGDSLTYSATGLPPGLSIDNTGKITGQISATAPGTYSVVVTATDDKGAATSETFAWTVTDNAPTTTAAIADQTFADSASIPPIGTAAAFTSPNGLPLTYSASGLPTGLSIDPTSGQITGQLDHDASKNGQTTTGSGAMLDGKYTVIVTASDGQGGTAMQTFTIDATNTAPTLVAQTTDQHGADGQTVSIATGPAFTDPNAGDTLTFSASNLPTGLSINASTGLISGTIDPHASSASPYAVTITATDDKGAATQEIFNFTVDNVAPVATPPLPDRSAYDGSNVNLTTSNGFTNPNHLILTYSATGLPSGLTIDSATGIISGTLSHDASAMISGGLYTIAVTADDGQGGSATNTFHLTASNQAPVVGTNTTAQTSKDGQTITPVDASQAFSDPNVGDTLTYTASNLPAGLGIDPATGKITGTIAANATPGDYYVTVTATDDKGAATPETFHWTVTNIPPQAVGTLANATYADSFSGVNINTASGFSDPNNLPLTYTATGLPTGLSIDPTTGLITGSLSHNASKNAPVTSGSGATLDGTYTVTITASDGQGGTATQQLKIDATNQAPIIGANTADQHGADGQPVSVEASQAFSDPNVGDTLTYAATNLPKGLTIDPTSGRITGTIDPTASASGPYAVMVTATDNKGAPTTETFTWTVDNVPPTAATAIVPASSPDGQAIVPIDTASHFNNPNGLPLTYSVTGLPTGLSIDPSTGMITGTVDHDASKNAPTTSGSGATLDGTYTVTVTANDGQGGTAVQTFTFDATNNAPVLGTATADQHSADSQPVTVDASKAFTDPNTGDVITYTASGLPKGLTIDPTTGLITGTIDPKASVTGPYTVTVTATDDKGAATSESFNWVVDNNPPTAGSAIAPASSPDGQAVTPIDTASHFSNPNGLPLTYSVTGLPAGLSIDPASGMITGTLDHDASKNAPTTSGAGATLDGTYSVTVTASDGQGGTATQTFTFDAKNNAPVIGTATANQRNADGQAVSVDASQAFSDPNTGDTLTYAATGLPKGLAIDPTTGKITGTIDPKASGTGPYTVMVTATDDKGAATTETFSWTIDDVPPTAGAPVPAVSSADGQAVATIDTASHFNNPNGQPLTYSATGLPAGLSIDPATGQVTGTLDHDASKNAPTTSGSGATLDGTYTVTVTASDGQGGTATQTFTIDATNQAPAVGTKTPNQANADGAMVSVDASQAFSDPNTGDTLTYAASGLPKGLGIDPATGKITGTIDPNASAAGPYTVTVTATDDKGAATTESFTWAVDDNPPTAGAPVAAATGADGQAIAPIDTASHFVNPNGQPLTYSVTGLPAGLSIDPTTGQITGTLDHDASKNAPTTSGSGATLDGTYTVTVTATDGQGGTATQTFTFDAKNSAPVIGTATATQQGADGQAVSVDASQAFSDPNTDALTYAATGLPKGLAIDPATGKITGTIDPSASANGPYTVTVTATDDKGAATTETFAWTVENDPPTAGAPVPPVSAADGQAIAPIDTASHFNSPNALSLTYSVTGLPAGLSIDPATGKITGTIDRNAAANAPTTSGSGATLDGTYTVTVTASDGQGGAATQTFTIDAKNAAPVVTTRTPDQQGLDGSPVSLATASAFADPNGDPLTYAASGLPKGLAIDPTTGRISGTIDPSASAKGPYTVMVTATDDKGAATSEAFAWTVGRDTPTATTPIPGVVAGDGNTIQPIDAASHFNDPNGLPLTYSATGLPTGLSIDPTTGRIAGTLDPQAARAAPQVSGQGGTLDGTYTVTVTADNGRGGVATQTFTIDATNNPPVVSNPTPSQAGVSGQPDAVDTAPAFSDPNGGDTLTYAATGLPPGLTIDPATGRISGTPTTTAGQQGSYTVTVTATDSNGASASETFAWTISPVAPSILPMTRNVPPSIVDVMAPPSLAVNDAVLDAVDLTSGETEPSITIHAERIVLSAVDDLQPLGRQQALDTPGAGIVRSGAATNERGDHIGRTQAAFDRDGLGGFSTATYVGASLRNASLLTGGTPTTINVETLVRDGVLTVSFDTASKVACVVPVARYEVTLADGAPLPSWLHVNPQGVVIGKVPPGHDAITIKVRAVLVNGIAIERTVTIRPDNGAIKSATPPVEKHAGRTLADMFAQARDSKVVRTGLSHLL